MKLKRYTREREQIDNNNNNNNLSLLHDFIVNVDAGLVTGSPPSSSRVVVLYLAFRCLCTNNNYYNNILFTEEAPKSLTDGKLDSKVFMHSKLESLFFI